MIRVKMYFLRLKYVCNASQVYDNGKCDMIIPHNDMPEKRVLTSYSQTKYVCIYI